MKVASFVFHLAIPNQPCGSEWKTDHPSLQIVIFFPASMNWPIHIFNECDFFMSFVDGITKRTIWNSCLTLDSIMDTHLIDFKQIIMPHVYDICYSVTPNGPVCTKNVLLKRHDCTFNIRFKIASSNGNIFRVTGPLCGEFTGHRWIPLTKVSDAGLWCFLWFAPEQTAEQTIETLVTWGAIMFIMTSL